MEDNEEREMEEQETTICPSCSGNGEDVLTGRICRDCKGSGEVRDE